MRVFHPIKQLAVLPVFGIPPGLFPVDNTDNSPPRAGPVVVRNDDVSQSEIPMSEIDIASIRKEVSIWSINFPLWSRSLTGGGSQ
jgi:hypothetical protein